VPRRIEARVTSGNIKLDFTDAVIAHKMIEIEAEVRSGNLIIITKPGIAVDTDDVAIRSGNVRVKAPWGSQAPVTVQITVSGRVGSGNIVARPPRRSFWDWLMRRPRRYAITSGT
jgi:cobalamin biosynthesis protein CbiG